MAVKKSTPAQDDSQTTNALSLLYEDMSEGGLADDFRGTVTSAHCVPWNYDGKRTSYTPALRLIIEPHADAGMSEAYTLHWTAGDLANIVPSEDGVTPAGSDMTFEVYSQLGAGEINPADVDTSDMVGRYLIPNEAGAKKHALSKRSNLGFAMMMLIDAGFDRDKVKPDVTFLEGLDAQWKRMLPPKRDNMEESGNKVQVGDKKEKKGDGKVLVPVEIFGYSPGGASKSAPSAKASNTGTEKKSSTSADSGTDLDTVVKDAIYVVLVEAGGEPVKKATLQQQVLATLAPSQKAKAIGMMGDNKFLSSDKRWTLNGNLLTLAAEDDE